ncbi:unnamed protein product [Leuciscus chuanchicus]
MPTEKDGYTLHYTSGYASDIDSVQFNSSSRSPFTHQTLFDCNLTTVAMAAININISTSNPTNEDRKTLPAKGNKCETGSTATSDVSPSEKHREDGDRSKPSSTTAVRRRYKTHTRMIKEKLDQIKAEMQKISKAHLHQRPERKACHPFVWNTLGPYRDTTEIDHLLTTKLDITMGRRRRTSEWFWSKEIKDVAADMKGLKIIKEM